MKNNSKKEMYSWAKLIGFTIIIIFICRQFIFSPVTVQGESMSSTLEDNDRVIISKTSSIKRFDTIVFNSLEGNEKLVKRVIGVAGDSIEMRDGTLYVNEEPIEEIYVNRKTKSNEITNDFKLRDVAGVSKVSEGHLFVLGDNRFRSKDSRNFGLVPEKSVIGEVKFKFYPFNGIGKKIK